MAEQQQQQNIDPELAEDLLTGNGGGEGAFAVDAPIDAAGLLTEDYDLAVSFAQKDAAKACGARWNALRKVWYAPAGTRLADFTPWLPKAPLTDLPGEDRTFGSNTLFVDLIPASCWFTNARSCLSGPDWERLRKFVYARANQACEVCGATDTRLEAHERWSYDHGRHIQKLQRLICLCEPCHTATHMGYAQVRGLGKEAQAHLQRVNGWELVPEQVESHLELAFEIWEERNKIDWELDLSLLENAGLEIVNPIGKYERGQHAQRIYVQRANTEKKKALKPQTITLNAEQARILVWAIRAYLSDLAGCDPRTADLLTAYSERIYGNQETRLFAADGPTRQALIDCCFWRKRRLRSMLPAGVTKAQAANILEDLYSVLTQTVAL